MFGQDVVERLMQERAFFSDLQMKNFLRKNNIPFSDDNPEKTVKSLREKGYRVIDENKTDAFGNVEHTLLFVKVLDQTSYKLNAPTWKMEDVDE